jgi:hypothetical protein
MSEYDEGWRSGEECMLAEIERLITVAETTGEQEILQSLIKHLRLEETLGQ